MSLKNDAQCFHYGSAAVITSSWKKKKQSVGPESHNLPGITLIKTSTWIMHLTAADS